METEESAVIEGVKDRALGAILGACVGGWLALCENHLLLLNNCLQMLLAQFWRN